MPQILTTNAMILCPHGGTGSTVPTIPKWPINGGYVAVEGDIRGAQLSVPAVSVHGLYSAARWD